MPDVQTSAGRISYALKRSRRRSLALRISPDGSVTVSAPRFALGGFIDRFVQQQADWIDRQLRRFREIAQEHPRKQFMPGEHFWFEGREIALNGIPFFPWAAPLCEAAGEQLNLRASEEDLRSSEFVKNALKRWYWAQTEKRVTLAIERFAPQLNVVPRRVQIANQRARWGSCSAQGDLRFNWRLSMLPPPVLDGVVVHELAHLVVHNHSSRFWAVVSSVVADHKLRRKWLRKYGPSLGF